LDGTGGETYIGCEARTWHLLDRGGEKFWYDDVEEVDDADEQEENTDSLSELSESELPDDVECWKSTEG